MGALYAFPAATPIGTTGTPAVELRQVSKWFGGETALDRVDLVVRPGEVHGLVGRNGAGKTTLLSILFGIVAPDEGSVRLLGRTRDDAGSGWLDGVGGCVESPRFYPYLSGRRNLALLARLDHGDSHRLVDQALDLVGLDDARTRKVGGYSLGMRQRLGLAAAIIRRPRVLILDEPANGLDAAGSRNLREALRAVGDAGASVLFSSHDIAQVDELSDSITVLDRGAVVFSGSAQRLRDEAPPATWRLSTGDEVAAKQVADRLGISLAIAGGAVLFAADEPSLDAFTIALGRAGVAIRSLAQAASPLERLLASLTGGAR